MKICWIKINVTNMDESIDFYEKLLGQTVCKRFKPTNSTEIAFLGSEDVKVELIQSQDQPTASETIGLSIGFQCKNIEEAMAKVVNSGLEAESGILHPNPNTSFFYVRDPDGIQIQVVELKENFF